MATPAEQKFGSNFLDDILDWIRSMLEPEDVFTKEQLQDWAESNGYVKES